MKNIFISKILNKNVLHIDDRSQQVDRILSIENMQKTILRERSRSDRNNHEFSVIVIDIEKFDHEQDSIDNIIQLLDSRLRLIDEIGWYDKQQIGIILPYTSSENAALVAEDVMKIITTDTPAKLSKILSYPSIWPFKNDGHQ